MFLGFHRAALRPGWQDLPVAPNRLEERHAQRMRERPHRLRVRDYPPGSLPPGRPSVVMRMPTAAGVAGD